MIENLIAFIWRWQTLFGSMIGAASPLLVWFIIEGFKELKRQKNELDLVHKILAQNIIRLDEVQKTIKRFLITKLDVKIIQLEKNAATVDIGEIFLPLIFLPVANDALLNTRTGSGYLENRLVAIHGVIHDMRLVMEDMRHQLRATFIMHNNLCMQEKGTPRERMEDLIRNLRSYRSIMTEEFLGQNLPTYLRLLVYARVVIEDVKKSGNIIRKLRFGPSFKYFKTYKEFSDYKANILNVLEDYYSEDVEKEFQRILKQMEN